MLEHGGQLHVMLFHYWLDLSTGINPNGWLVPYLSPTAWARLPEINDGLEQAAQAYM